MIQDGQCRVANPCAHVCMPLLSEQSLGQLRLREERHLLADIEAAHAHRNVRRGTALRQPGRPEWRTRGFESVVLAVLRPSEVEHELAPRGRAAPH